MTAISKLRHTGASVLFARSTTDPTDEHVDFDELGFEHEDNYWYVPSPWWILHCLLPRSEVNPGDVFVDFGCGKGRIVLAAARRYRFRDVIGVELSPQLSGIARQLIARERKLRAENVHIETTDAAEFQVPNTMTHAYMFNPFRGEIMQRVCDNIAASLERNPRRIRLFYAYPEEHNTVTAAGFRFERQVRATRLGVGLGWIGIYTT